MREFYNHNIITHFATAALTFANVSTRIFNGWVATDIWQQAKTESVASVRVSIAINNDARRRCMEHFTNAIV